MTITYAGELGYEILDVPNERALAVWDAIVAAGPAYGLSLYGLKALASLRLERAIATMATTSTTPMECMKRGWVSRSTSPVTSWAGRPPGEPRSPRRGGEWSRLLTDPAPLLFHAEPVLRDGEFGAGYIRAASYGWTLGWCHRAGHDRGPGGCHGGVA